MINRKTICKHPFTALAIKKYDNEGKLITAWPCCMMGNPTKEEGETNSYDADRLGIKNIEDLTPQEIFFHPRMNELRENLKNGIRDEACKVCWDQEDRNIKSFRNVIIADQTDEMMEEYVNEPRLDIIDTHINNACNLRCRMCDPNASSLLQIDHNYFKKNELLDDLYSSAGRWATKQNIFDLKNVKQWDWIYNNADKFKVLRMSGGEPFYNHHVLNFLDHCIEKGFNKTLTLEFHTNATLFDSVLLDKVKHFNNNLNFSIDGTGKVYEYIRYPMNWQQLDTSVKRFIEVVDQEVLNINFIVMITNLFNIPDFYRWLVSLNKPVTLTFSEVYFMDRGISLYNLPISILKHAKAKILNIELSKHIFTHNMLSIIDDAIKNNTENRKKAFTEIMLFDASRQQHYKDYLDPIIVEWLDGEKNARN
jgi:molybdenum cofactor biosynthesis enzyme MoaA